jgi:astacin
MMKTYRLIVLSVALALASCTTPVTPDRGPTGGTTSKCANLEQNEAARAEMFAMADPANVRPAVISGLKKKNIRVKGYVVDDGDVVYEGDIVVGKVGNQGTTTKGVVITGRFHRWPNGDVPYRIDPTLPNPGRVREAIRHWEAKTVLRFPPYDPARHTDFVTFVPKTTAHCSSPVGKQGREQRISLSGGCEFGQVVHEIGHAIGLWHEQSREDRNNFVCIQWANIDPDYRYNFDQNISNGDDVGGYDYDSIMHYGDHDFSTNRQATIVSLKSGVRLGQRSHLSAGDVATVRALYTGIASAERF